MMGSVVFMFCREMGETCPDEWLGARESMAGLFVVVFCLFVLGWLFFVILSVFCCCCFTIFS